MIQVIILSLCENTEHFIALDSKLRTTLRSLQYIKLN